MSNAEPTYHKVDTFKPITVQNQDMLGYWRSLRDDLQVPLWDAFDPLDILGTLENCLILEFVDAGLIRIRLVGNGIVERLGADLTGKNLFDLYDGDQKQGLKERTELLRTRPAILRSIIAGQSSMSVPVVAESMVFPFREPDGVIKRGLLSIRELSADEPKLAGRIGSVSGTELLQLDVLDL